MKPLHLTNLAPLSQKAGSHHGEICRKASHGHEWVNLKRQHRARPLWTARSCTSEGHSLWRQSYRESLVWYCQKTHKCFIRASQKKRKIKPHKMTSFDFVIMEDYKSRWNIGLEWRPAFWKPENALSGSIFSYLILPVPASLHLKRKKVIRLSSQGQLWSHLDRKIYPTQRWWLGRQNGFSVRWEGLTGAGPESFAGPRELSFYSHTQSRSRTR